MPERTRDSSPSAQRKSPVIPATGERPATKPQVLPSHEATDMGPPQPAEAAAGGGIDEDTAAQIVEADEEQDARRRRR